MNAWLGVAALFAVFAGTAHSYLGERYILIRLLRYEDLPKLRGSDVFTKQVLRLAWHVTSIAWWSMAVLFVVLGRADAKGGLRVLSATFAVTAVVTAVSTRGRHFAWPVFTVIAAAAWLGS